MEPYENIGTKSKLKFKVKKYVIPKKKSAKSDWLERKVNNSSTSSKDADLLTLYGRPSSRRSEFYGFR